MTGSGQPASGDPADIHSDIAHPARVYDYWLGGKDNSAADRAAAEQVLKVMPEILDTVRGNRQFLVRAVRFLRDAGIRQFIDLGSGLPSSPNVHEVAQAGDTGARVVYVDNGRYKSSCAHAPGRSYWPEANTGAEAFRASLSAPQAVHGGSAHAGGPHEFGDV